MFVDVTAPGTAKNFVVLKSSARMRALLERWMSGLSRTPGKRVWDNIPPRVRIPPSPPEYRNPEFPS